MAESGHVAAVGVDRALKPHKILAARICWLYEDKGAKRTATGTPEAVK